MNNRVSLLFALCCLLGLTGTGIVLPQQAAEKEAKPPKVQVSLPVEMTVTDHQDFPGRTEAVLSVDIRARVSGYLIRAPFKEGSLVKKGDLLYEIDPRPYQAELDRAKAQLELAEVRLKVAKADLERSKKLLAASGISREDYEKIAAAQSEAETQVKAAQASLEIPRLNLMFTRVTAPIDGRIGRSLVSVGNVVVADKTSLTTLVSQNSIYGYFDVDANTVPRLLRLVRGGQGKTPPVLLGLVGETGFPHEGTIDFVNNKVDPTTGALQVRGIFANKDQLLIPGMFGRIRLPFGEPHKALLIADQALFSGEEKKFVYLVNDKKEIVARQVKVGSLEGGLRVIEQGILPNELVVVKGPQGLQPGTKVETEVVPMPRIEKEP